MRKVKVIEKTVQQEIVEDVLCNMCGSSCGIKLGETKEYYGLIEITVSGGYASPKLGDCSLYRFSICEYCLDELFNKFKIPVEEPSISLRFPAEEPD